jgi:hypothetical protein
MPSSKKQVLLTSILVVFFLLSIGGLIIQIYLSQKNICDEVTLASIRNHFNINVKANLLSKKAIGNVCEIIIEENSKPELFYASDNFIIKGTMYSNKHNLSVAGLYEYTSQEFLKKKNEIDNSVCIHYIPAGHVRHTLYMFEKPDCPFCIESLLKLRNKLDEYHTELKILFLAYDGDLRLKSINIVCSNMNLDSFIARALNNDFAVNKPCEKGTAAVDKAGRLGKNLFITNVPVFFLENGLMIQGGNIDAIIEALKK